MGRGTEHEQDEYEYEPELERWLGRRVVALEDLSDPTRAQALDAWARALLEDVEQRRLREVLVSFIDRLPPRYRSLLEALFYERTTEAELGRRLGISHSAVARRRRTALRALAREVALEDPAFVEFERSMRTGKRGRPRRNYKVEAEAAWRVLSGRLKVTGPSRWR